MKLVSFNHDGKDGYGAVLGDGILDLSGALYQESHFSNLREVLSAGPGALTELRRLVDAGSATLGLSDVKIRMPIHNPTKIFCVGRNYYAYHEVKEDGRPEDPRITNVEATHIHEKAYDAAGNFGWRSVIVTRR